MKKEKNKSDITMDEYKGEREKKYSLFVCVIEDKNSPEDNAPEREKNKLLNYIALCEEHMKNGNIKLACDVCGKMYMLISEYHKLSNMLCTEPIAKLLLSLLDTEDMSIAFPVLCINICLTSNEKCFELYESTPLFEKLMTITQSAIDLEEESTLPLVRSLFSSICSLLSKSVDLRKRFLESDGIALAMHALTKSEEGDELTDRQIGFIFYYLLLDVNEISEIHEHAKEVMSILLNKKILDSAFCIIQQLLRFKEIVDELQSANLFSIVFDLGEFILELFKKINDESIEQHVKGNSKRAVNNWLVILIDILQSTDKTLNCSQVPLNELFEICLSRPTNTKICVIALEVLCLYADKNINDAEELFEMPFIRLMLEKAAEDQYNVRVKFCLLLLRIFMNLPSVKYDLIEYDMWNIIFDSVEDEDSFIAEYLSICLDKVLTQGYSINHFEDFTEKIEQLSNGEQPCCAVFSRMISSLSISE